MKKPWRLREATPADADDLAHCMVSAYATYQERMGGERLPPMDVDYSTEIANYPTWVVESMEGNILGGLIMDIEENKASIANIAVDPQSQGQGIGGALMNLAEEQAKTRGFSSLDLATHSLLEENVSLYLHLGWQETGREGSKVFMQKKLQG